MNENERLFTIEEYKDSSMNMRHYSNLRFAQLTIFMAASGGLFALYFGSDREIDALLGIAIIFAGFLIVFAFAILEERIYRYWLGYYRRAVRLEEKLGFKQHTDRWSHPLVKGQTAVRGIYLGGFISWTVVAVHLGGTIL